MIKRIIVEIPINPSRREFEIKLPKFSYVAGVVSRHTTMNGGHFLLVHQSDHETSLTQTVRLVEVGGEVPELWRYVGSFTYDMLTLYVFLRPARPVGV
jgi:hypothetical protein